MTPETPEQAVERYASWDSESSGDWLYFCTVHPHCSTSAFPVQAPMKANERNQDGLHTSLWAGWRWTAADLHAPSFIWAETASSRT